MALPLRHLILAALAVIPLLLASPLAAQTGPKPEPEVFFTLRVQGELPELFYDHQGKQILFSSRIGGLSRPHPKPAGGIVALYREVPAEDPSSPPVRVPVTKIDLGPGGTSSLVLISASPDPANPAQPRIATLVIDHSLKAHPAHSVRVINLCQTRVAFQTGSDLGELSPSQNRLVPYPAPGDDYLETKAALWTDGAWHVRLTSRLRIIHGTAQNADTRALWLLTSPPPTADDPEPRVFVRNIIDFLPAKEPRVATAR